MKRNENVITDIREIHQMLEHCTTINLGLQDDPCPYVVPMTFGCALADEKLVVYFHCAGEGHKRELLQCNPAVCVEAHLYERVSMAGPKDITAIYESVIGFGTARLVEDPAEKLKAMKIMLEHYNSSGFPATSCAGMKRVEVYQVVLESVTGKRSK